MGCKSVSTQEPYNKNGMILFGLGMGVVFLFFIYIVAIHPGVKMDENIRDPKDAAAGGGLATAFDASKIAEPWVTTPEMIAHGKKLYQTNCAFCHGNEGKGDGSAGQGLNPPPRDLVEGKWKFGNDAISHFKLISIGSPGTSMAAYGHLSKADRWALVHFIDSITQNKTPDDVAKMKEFHQSTN